MNRKISLVFLIVLVIITTIIVTYIDYFLFERYIVTLESDLGFAYVFRNIFWGIFIILSAIFGLILIRHGAQEVQDSRGIYEGYGFYSLGLAGNRLFFHLNDIGIMTTQLAINQSTLIGYSIVLFSSLALIHMMENDIFHTKNKILSIIVIITASISGAIALAGFFIREISLWTNLVRYIVMIIAVIVSSIIIILYIKILRTIGIENRIHFLKTLGILIGISLVSLGILLDGALFESLIPTPEWICPLISILGSFFIYYSQLIIGKK